MSDTNFNSINRLLEELKTNLHGAKLSLQQQERLLGRIKLASRQPDTAAPLTTRESVGLLATYGLERGSTAASKEALRSLANVLLLNIPSRQIIVDLGHGCKAADQLRQCDVDEEFLCARILFLLSYNTSLDFTELVHRHGLAESLVTLLNTHAQSAQELGQPSEPTTMATSEVLRLAFNIQHFFPALKGNFLATLSPIATILLTSEWPSPVLQAPLASVINALLGLDLKAAIELKGQTASSTLDHRGVVGCLIKILDRAILEHTEKELDQGAVPLCTLLRKIYDLADSGTRTHMQSIMLPTEADRARPLGQGDSFSARLLRLTNSPQLPTLRDNISNLLYELSEQDPERFVYNVGYGYASGFLMSHNIAVPADTAGPESIDIVPTNPVTGQKLSTENKDAEDLPEMTDEEKEREAERLFVLFERLKATGVVDVKNPVEDYHHNNQGGTADKQA